MFDSLDVWGAYCFWAAMCFCGLVILGVWMPETKGIPIERMGELFDGPWYLRWRATVGPADSKVSSPPSPSPCSHVDDGEVGDDKKPLAKGHDVDAQAYIIPYFERCF